VIGIGITDYRMLLASDAFSGTVALLSFDGVGLLPRRTSTVFSMRRISYSLCVASKPALRTKSSQRLSVE